MSTKLILPMFLNSVFFNLDTIFDLAAHKCSVPAQNFLSESQILFNYAKFFVSCISVSMALCTPSASTNLGHASNFLLVISLVFFINVSSITISSHHSVIYTVNEFLFELPLTLLIIAHVSFNS